MFPPVTEERKKSNCKRMLWIVGLIVLLPGREETKPKTKPSYK